MAKAKYAIASDLINSFGYLFDNCTYIQDAGGCDRCPLKTTCLDDTSVSEFIDSVTDNRIEEFLGFGEDVENYANEQDMQNYHEWMKAEMERELWGD